MVVARHHRRSGRSRARIGIEVAGSASRENQHHRIMRRRLAYRWRVIFRRPAGVVRHRKSAWRPRRPSIKKLGDFRKWPPHHLRAAAGMAARHRHGGQCCFGKNGGERRHFIASAPMARSRRAMRSMRAAARPVAHLRANISIFSARRK